MTTGLSTIWAIALADFRERSRRYSFWVFLVLIAYATYLFIPAAGAPYTTVRFDVYRGLYNSAWVSSQVTLMTVVILSLVGFYFIKGAVNRERRLKTHELLASSPINNLTYLAGKFGGNVMVLLSMILTLALTSAILQFARNEDRAIKILDLLAPYLLIIAPVMIFIAALAILFDCVRFLRGGIGNVIFYCFWVFAIVTGGMNNKQVTPLLDFFGISYLWNQMMDGCSAAFRSYVPWEGIHSLGFNFTLSGPPQLETFFWSGPHWSPSFLVGRVVLLIISIGVVSVSASLFRRFDEEPGKARRWFRSKQQSSISEKPPVADATSLESQRITTLTPLAARTLKVTPLRLLNAELRIALNGVSKWWYLVAAGIFVAGMLTPFAISHKFLLAAAWFWPLLIWSAMGCRDQLFDTRQLVQSTPGGIWAQLSMQWLAGFSIAIVIGGFIGIRTLITGDFDLLAHWLIGAMFIPSLAIAGGVITGGRKLFEVLYTLIFYVGPLNKTPMCDFTGSVTYAGIQPSLLLWSGITSILIITTLALRKWQVLRS